MKTKILAIFFALLYLATAPYSLLLFLTIWLAYLFKDMLKEIRMLRKLRRNKNGDSIYPKV